MKTVLIVEDHVKSLEMLVAIINDLKMDLTVYTATNVRDAYSITRENNIDLFILDIILESTDSADASGMEFAAELREMKRYQYTPIIFVTSLEDPKLHAYSDVHCYYYIEKPYDVQVVSKMVSEALSIPQVKHEKKSVYFRKDGILYKKNISEVVYIENARSGQVIHFIDGEMRLSYKPTHKILEELNNDNFIQCSRYAIINKDYIDSIDIVNRYITLKRENKQIEIGITFKNKFMRDTLDD